MQGGRRWGSRGGGPAVAAALQLPGWPSPCRAHLRLVKGRGGAGQAGAGARGGVGRHAKPAGDLAVVSESQAAPLKRAGRPACTPESQQLPRPHSLGLSRGGCGGRDGGRSGVAGADDRRVVQEAGHAAGLGGEQGADGCAAGVEAVCTGDHLPAAHAGARGAAQAGSRSVAGGRQARPARLGRAPGFAIRPPSGSGGCVLQGSLAGGLQSHRRAG